jgi:hypothetical protein
MKLYKNVSCIRKSRVVANSLGISMIGVPIEAKREGLDLAVKPMLNDVITRAFFGGATKVVCEYSRCCWRIARMMSC